MHCYKFNLKIGASTVRRWRRLSKTTSGQQAIISGREQPKETERGPMPDDQALENELLDHYRALTCAEKAELRATAKKLAEHPADAPQDPAAHEQ